MGISQSRSWEVKRVVMLEQLSWHRTSSVPARKAGEEGDITLHVTSDRYKWILVGKVLQGCKVISLMYSRKTKWLIRCKVKTNNWMCLLFWTCDKGRPWMCGALDTHIYIVKSKCLISLSTSTRRVLYEINWPDSGLSKNCVVSFIPDYQC